MKITRVEQGWVVLGGKWRIPTLLDELAYAHGYRVKSFSADLGCHKVYPRQPSLP